MGCVQGSHKRGFSRSLLELLRFAIGFWHLHPYRMLNSPAALIVTESHYLDPLSGLCQAREWKKVCCRVLGPRSTLIFPKNRFEFIRSFGATYAPENANG